MIELIDFGDLYNKTSIERGGMLYNSSPRKIQWVAINQNDLEGTKSVHFSVYFSVGNFGDLNSIMSH